MTEPIKLQDISIRTELQSGDIGYVIHLHGRLYKKEYDYGLIFEDYVAIAVSEFYKNYDSAKDCVWIAEYNGTMVGFLALMHRGADSAQLRFFILEPFCRGMGLAKKMTGLLMEFLKATKYKHCYLWTSNEQLEAAALYSKLGFRLTEEKDSFAFGKLLREQRYDLDVEGADLP